MPKRSATQRGKDARTQRPPHRRRARRDRRLRPPLLHLRAQRTQKPRGNLRPVHPRAQPPGTGQSPRKRGLLARHTNPELHLRRPPIRRRGRLYRSLHPNRHRPRRPNHPQRRAPRRNSRRRNPQRPRHPPARHRRHDERAVERRRRSHDRPGRTHHLAYRHPLHRQRHPRGRNQLLPALCDPSNW